MRNKYPKNNFIDKILWKFVIPNFNKLIIPIENSIISSTNNKIENIFEKIFPKHIKRRMKIEKRVLTRLC